MVHADAGAVGHGRGGVDDAAAPLRRPRVRAATPTPRCTPRCSTGFPLEYPAPALVVFLVPLLLPLSYPWAFAVLVGVALVVLVTSYEGTRLAGLGRPRRGTVDHLPGPGGGHGPRRPLRHLRHPGRVLVAVEPPSSDRWSAAWTWSSVGFVAQALPRRVLARVPHRRVAPHGRIPLRRLWWMAGVGGRPRRGPRPARPRRRAQRRCTTTCTARPRTGACRPGLSVLLDWHGTNWVATLPQRQRRERDHRGRCRSAFELAGVGACLWVWWAQVRGRLPLEAACLATLTFVMLGSKVLSAQYLIWLMPLWALYRLRVTWLLAAAANLVVFPYVVSAQGSGTSPATPSRSASRSRSSPATCSSGRAPWRWLRTELVSRTSRRPNTPRRC